VSVFKLFIFLFSIIFNKYRSAVDSDSKTNSL